MWQQQQGQPNANDGNSQGWQANGSWPAQQQQPQPQQQQQSHHAPPQPQNQQQQQYQIQYAAMLRQQQQQQSQHAQQQQGSQRQMSAGSANHGYPSAHGAGATSPLNTPGGVVEPSVLSAFRQAANGSGLQPHQRHQSSGQRTPGVQQPQSNFPPHYNGVSPGSTQPQPQQGWSQFVPPSVLTPSHEAARFNLAATTNPHQQQFHPHHQQQFAPQQQQQRQQMQQLHAQQQPQPGAEEDEADKKAGGPGQKQGTSDFVKKLFTMLDDLSYASIVSWSNVGDSFVVRNMNDFTKHVLPRHFRHSNFASFVRQLNKYDFHKVKNPEEQASQPADQIWEFKHPDFVRGREDLLENVRRKLPSGKKKTGEDRDNSPTMLNASEAAERGAEEYNKLKDQIASLTATQDMMSSHIDKLTKQYQGVIGEMLTFQKNMVQQDQLMQNLIQYLMNLENDRKISAPTSSSAPAIAEGPFLSAQETQRLVGSYDQVMEASFGQMSEIAQRQQQQQQQSGGRSPRRDGGLAATPSGASPRSQAAGSTLGGNLSPKSFATHSPANTAGREATATPASSAKTPAVSASSSSNTTGPSSSSSAMKPDQTQAHHPDHNMFLHPPHLDNDESSTLFNTAANSVSNPTLAGFEGAGLRVFTVGTLQPRDGSGEGVSPSTLDAAFARAVNKERSPSSGPDKQAFGLSVPPIESLPARMPKLDQRTTSTNPTPNPHGDGEGSGSRSGTPSEGGSNLLRVRRSTYVPGWAVPPRVLLVDDDAVSRKLSSKFLQVFGCEIDVAVDGVNAVNKMNLEQYDLVLMDIVMPNLDGVSATSLIREFDPRTPIISMTSNSGPHELLNYMSSGMNDILPKPFTKEGLLNMLEKHLIHLKTVQKMDQIPKQLGLPPVTKETLQSVLSATAASTAALDLPEGSLSSASGKALAIAAALGNGPGVKLESSDASPPGFADDDDANILNPLSGMGFSDEEYIRMMQSLIAAGTISGDMSDDVAGVMGVHKGEGASGSSSNPSRSQEGTPADVTQSGFLGSAVPSTNSKKRAHEGSPPRDAEQEKKSKARFSELAT